MRSRPVYLLLALLVISFAARGWFLSRAKAPWCDEGWFAAAAHNLAFRGHSGIPVEPTGFFLDATLPGIQQHTFLVPPLHLWLLAGWYRLVGFSLDLTRLYGVLWGAAGLVVLFALVQTVWRRPWLSLLAVSLCGFDLTYLWASADGRMDLPAMVMSLAGWLAWQQWRRTNPLLGFMISHTCLALACLLHLNAVVSLAALWVLILLRDRRRLEWKWLPLAAVPFGACGVLWGIYIDGHYSQFWAQFIANVRGHSGVSRMADSWTPFFDITDEVVSRYLAAFGFNPFWMRRLPGPFPALILFYFAALGWLVFQRRWWKGRAGALGVLCVFQIVAYALLIRFKAQNYLAYLMPLWNVLLAVSFWRLWHAGAAPRFLACWSAAIWVTLQLWGYQWKLTQPDRREFVEMTRYLRQLQAPPQARLAGPTLLVFELGFETPFREDARIGLRSHRRPDVVVLDGYRAEFEKAMQRGEPDVWLAYEASLRHDYQSIWRKGAYEIYVRRPPANTSLMTSPPR